MNMNESRADSQKMALSQYHDLSLHIKKPFRWCTLTIAFIVVVWYWRPNGSTGLRSRLQGGLYRRSSYSPTPPGGGATGALMWHKTSPFLSLLSSFCLFRARRNLRPFFAGKILLRSIRSLKPQICLTRKLCKRGRNISRVQIQKCHGFSISGW